MKLKELLRFIEYNQKLMLTHGIHTQDFKGKAREVNLTEFGERDVDFIYLDSDIYSKDYIKIQLKKE